MNWSSKFVVRSIGALLPALAFVLASCASGEGSSSNMPSGPTVKVKFDSQPTAALIINGDDLGLTPLDVNIPVDETTGFLRFDVSISFDSSKAMGGGKNAGSGNSAKGSVSWKAGKHMPATVTLINGRANESREYAPANPPTAKAMVQPE